MGCKIRGAEAVRAAEASKVAEAAEVLGGAEGSRCWKRLNQSWELRTET